MVLKFDNDNIYGVINNRIVYILDAKDKKVIKEIKSSKKNLYDENIIVYKDYLIFWQDNGKVTVLNTNTERIINKRLFFSETIEDLELR